MLPKEVLADEAEASAKAERHRETYAVGWTTDREVEKGYLQ